MTSEVTAIARASSWDGYEAVLLCTPQSQGCFELNEEIFLKPLVFDRAWPRIRTQLTSVVPFGLRAITEEMAENQTEVKI